MPDAPEDMPHHATPLEELGRAREGTLAESPFPVLLQALFTAERTATVELRQRQLVKRIALEDGLPVDCESNLMHETPGRYLVERGRLDEAGNPVFTNRFRPFGLLNAPCGLQFALPSGLPMFGSRIRVAGNDENICV